MTTLTFADGFNVATVDRFAKLYIPETVANLKLIYKQ